MTAATRRTLMMPRPSLTKFLSAMLAITALSAVGRAQNAAHSTLAIGSSAPDFNLLGIDDKWHSLGEFQGSEVLAVVFTCPHCPAAQLYEGRIKQLVDDYRPKGVAFVVIQPNALAAVAPHELNYTDVDDSLEGMKIRAAYRHFNFPYLYDGDTQQ